jgi:CheY-like chemotaxis protein
MKIRTLVMEQDPTLRELISMVVKAQGYEVVSYSDPGACLVYGGGDCRCPSGTACSDIIITDNKMPRMTGLHFIQRQMLRGCQSPLANKAVMSANWHSEELDQAAALGCKIFTKPFPMQELANWLKECQTRIDTRRKLAQLDPC